MVSARALAPRTLLVVADVTVLKIWRSFDDLDDDAEHEEMMMTMQNMKIF